MWVSYLYIFGYSAVVFMYTFFANQYKLIYAPVSTAVAFAQRNKTIISLFQKMPSRSCRYSNWAKDLIQFNLNITKRSIKTFSFSSSQGSDNLTTYTFNTHVAKHTFCKTCGVQSFYTPRSNPDGYGMTSQCWHNSHMILMCCKLISSSCPVYSKLSRSCLLQTNRHGLLFHALVLWYLLKNSNEIR